MADAERFLVVALTEQWPEGQPLASWTQHIKLTTWMTGESCATIGAIMDIAVKAKPFITAKRTQPKHELGEQLVLLTMSAIDKVAGQKDVHRNFALRGMRSF